MGSVGTGSLSNSGFKEGDTPRVFNDDDSYDIIRVMKNGDERNYGPLPGSDVKSMLRNYKFNGLFWERNGVGGYYEVKKRRK